MLDADNQHDSVTEPIRKPFVRIAVRWAGVLLAVYLLSPGPLTLLGQYGIFGDAADEFFEFFFAPIAFLSDNVAAVKHFYDWYISLFW